MYKFAVLFALVACSMAAPAPKPGLLAAAPAVAYHAAPAVAVVPAGASSYAYSHKVAYKSPLYAAAPAYTAYAPAAPLAYTAHAAPVAYTAHAAPLAYAAHPAPLTYTSYVH